MDLAAEYARAAPPAQWLPIPVVLTLHVLLFGYFIWTIVVPGFPPGGNILLVLHVATIIAGYAAGFYAGLLGICYVGCWLIGPIGLGQRRSLGRTLFVANAGAALLLLLGMVLGGVWAHDRWGHAWNNDPREIGTLIPLLWFTTLTAMLWTVPQKQHLWVLLSVVAISVSAWGWFGPSLLSPQLHSYGLNTTLLYLVVVCTAVPLAVALLGFLPPGRLRRQPT
jgi:ABC-type transport system involved in cytochrome c biogenesis permease subunit